MGALILPAAGTDGKDDDIDEKRTVLVDHSRIVALFERADDLLKSDGVL